jgi:hypothetical protein
MFFFSANPLVFDEGEFYTIQDMSGLPALPPGRTVIGQGYNLVTTPGAPMMNGSISFEYMGNDVLAAGGDETTLTIYYWDGTTWTALPTVRDPYYNMASARSQGSGMYVLMSSVEIALEAAGWNLIAYPVKQTRSVPDALKSIEGYYTQVMGYDATNQYNPWRRYIVGLPAWLAPYINNLHEMEFGKGYFVYATDEQTLYLPHDGAQSLASADEDLAAALASMPQHAPATYYGIVQASDTFMPAADMPVVAKVNDIVCGQGYTQEVDGNIIYAVEVYSDEPGVAEGCGATGRTVTFQVGDEMLATTALWDSSQVNELNLSTEPAESNNVIYLPLITR